MIAFGVKDAEDKPMLILNDDEELVRKARKLNPAKFPVIKGKAMCIAFQN